MEYAVRKGIGFNSRVLRLGDRVLERGTVFDTSEFPDLSAADFKRFESHRLIESVDAKAEERAAAERRQAREMARARLGASRVTASEPEVSSLRCPDCEYFAKNAHGLKVHRGRSHKE